MRKTTEDVLEIDLFFLVKKILEKKYFVLLLSMLCMLSVFVYERWFVKPVYESSTKIYVVYQNNTNALITVQDLQIGSNLVKDFKQIILSSLVLDTLIQEKGLTLTKEALKKKISVFAPQDTRVLEIVVTDEQAVVASDLANHLREISIRVMKDITKISEINTLEKAVPAAYPSANHLKKNVFFAFLFGFSLSIVVLLFRALLDNKVNDPEDIAKMDMVLLGVVPYIKKGKK